MRRSPKFLRYLSLLVLLAGEALCVGFGPPRLAAHDIDGMSLWPHQVQELGALVPPDLDAGAGLLLDVTTKALLYGKNHEKRLAPASTTKMMTALIALQRGNLADEITIEAADLTTPSYGGLEAGETMTLEKLLHVLLLPSDNAAALVIARYVAGSEAAFVALMNQQAAEWGLKNTHFANPHGLDDPDHYSTAMDLAQIALHAMENPAFARIAGTREYRIGDRVLHNTNELLGTYDGAEGVKTGTTDEAGQCLVSLVDRPTGRVLCIVMGSQDRYRDARQLLDFYYAGYVTVSLKLGPRGLNEVRWLDGSEFVLALRDSRRVLLPRWQLPWLRTQRVGIEPAPVDAEAGMVRFMVGDQVLAEMPVYGVAP